MSYSTIGHYRSIINSHYRLNAAFQAGIDDIKPKSPIAARSPANPMPAPLPAKQAQPGHNHNRGQTYLARDSWPIDGRVVAALRWPRSVRHQTPAARTNSPINWADLARPIPATLSPSVTWPG